MVPQLHNLHWKVPLAKIQHTVDMTLNRIWITSLTTVAYPHTNKLLTLSGIYDDEEEEKKDNDDNGSSSDDDDNDNDGDDDEDTVT